MSKIRSYYFIVGIIIASFALFNAGGVLACDNCGNRNVGAEWCEGTTRKACVANDGTRLCASGNSTCSNCNCVSACVPSGGGYQCSEPDPTCPDPFNNVNQNTVDIGTCAADPTPTPTPSTASIYGNVSCVGGSAYTTNLANVRVFAMDSSGSVRGDNLTNGSGNFSINNFNMSAGNTHYAVRARSSGNTHDPLFQQLGTAGAGCSPAYEVCPFSTIAGNHPWPNPFNFRSSAPQNLTTACNAGTSATYTWQHVANAQSYVLRIDYDEQPNTWNPQPVANGGNPGDLWIGLTASSYCNFSTNICTYIHNSASPKPFLAGPYYGFSVQARGIGDVNACRREYGVDQSAGGHQSYVCVPPPTPTPTPTPSCTVTLNPVGPVNVNVGASTTLTGRITVAAPPGVSLDRISFVSANTGLLNCTPGAVNNPGLNTNVNTTCTASATTGGTTTVRAYVNAGGVSNVCASNQVTVHVNPTCSITSVLPNPWNVQVDSGPQQFTASVTRVPAGATTTVTFTENDPGNAFSCSPLTDSTQPYQTTCTPQAVGSGSLITTATITSGGRTGNCGPFVVPVNISPTPTPTPTPTVGPVRLKGAYVSGEGFQFTRPVVVSGDEAPITFEYDPKYLVDFVQLIGEAFLDWVEVR